MDRIVNVNTVADFDRIWGIETRHPLVNVMDGTKLFTRCRIVASTSICM